MKYIVPPTEVPLNALLDICPAIGGDSVEGVAHYTPVVFQWDVN